MFNNCNSKKNGEQYFYKLIKDNINVIFDVGCRSDSEFLNFNGEVHYFDPVPEFIEKIKSKPNFNKESYFNNFGLGLENAKSFYYPKYQSFHDRKLSCKISDDANKIILSIVKGKDYIINNNVTHIDFLKIDTEGHELNVIKGFQDSLENIKIIQFEYGGTFLDSNTKLINVIEYLREWGFQNFSYLTNSGPVIITNFNDHYKYCNIVYINKKSDYKPF